MKRRFIAAGLAAATALSLSVAPAQADEKPGYHKESSSQVTDAEVLGYAIARAVVEGLLPGQGVSQPYLGSSKAGMFDIPEDKAGAQKDLKNGLMSSFRNDANRGYKLGTTYDILVGTGIAALVLAALGGAAYAGVIPGVQLPF